MASSPKSPTFAPIIRPNSLRSSIDFDNMNKQNEYDVEAEQLFESVEKSIEQLYQFLKTEEREANKDFGEKQGKYDQYETYHHISQMQHHLKRALYHRRRFSLPLSPNPGITTSTNRSAPEEIHSKNISSISEAEEDNEGVVLRKPRNWCGTVVPPTEPELQEAPKEENAPAFGDETVLSVNGDVTLKNCVRTTTEEVTEALSEVSVNGDYKNIKEIVDQPIENV